MKETVIAQTEGLARDWLTLLLTGLGISFLAHEYVGGLFLALAGASIASRFDQETDRKAFWLVMLVAFFVSHVAAIVAQAYAPTWSPQLVMASAGFASRYATRTALRVLGLLEKRSDKIADHIVDRVFPSDPNAPPRPKQKDTP